MDLRKDLCELLEKKCIVSNAQDGTVAGACSTESPEVGNEDSNVRETKRFLRSRRLRARSSSYDNTSASGDTTRKRASFPRSAEDVQSGVSQSRFSPHGDEPPEAKRVMDSRCHIVGSESLRTLLQMQNPNVLDAVRFVPTVTVGNAAKSLAELAIATPASFSCLLPAGDQPVTQLRSSVIVKRRTGPSIVKPVKPTNKPIASVRPLSSDHYIKSATEVVLDEDHNHINAHTVGDSSLSPEKKECAISFHDNENNMEAVDERWVIDRIAQLRLETNSTAPSPDDEDAAANHSSVANSTSTPSVSSVAIDEHCDQCRIHKSWLVAAMMARACKRIKINYNTASTGVVPLTRDQWKNLLKFRLSSRSVGKSPCVRCETALSRCLAIFKSKQQAGDGTLKVPSESM
ncbi:hypothetical protein COOONC_00108 [Cooperia oncophora]